MYLHRSNRVEELASVLANVVKRPLASPFDREIIVVQSRGMQRWLSMELSQRLGVLANAEFPFPRVFLERLFKTFLPPLVDTGELTREFLIWGIAAALPKLVERKEFAQLARYLKNSEGFKPEERVSYRVALAEKIAHVFDQYAVYRPDLVLGWEAGKGQDWQAELWREVVAKSGRSHVASLAQRFLAEWSPLFAPAGSVPERVSIFGISSLPPIYVSVLGALAERIDVHLFLLSPSREYWATTRSRREIERERRKLAPRENPDDVAELHLSEGNALLASLGRVGREFQHVLEATTNYVESDANLYYEPGTSTLLATLQADMLALRHRGRDPAFPALAWQPADASLVLHCCHSALREVEVLREQLLDLFERDSTLTPRDVVVMAPDIETYAPLIEAVFGSGGDHEPLVPYRIADRTERKESVVIEAFLTALKVVAGRMKASEVLDLLQLEPVRQRFGIAAEELTTIQHWVHDAGIRWGADALDRERSGLPAVDDNTWLFGLRRLFLGYALAERELELFAGQHPYDAIEGESALLLGALGDFCALLFEWRSLFRESRTFAAWGQVLSHAVEQLLLPPEGDAWQLQLLRDAIFEITAVAEAAGFDEVVPLEVLSTALGKRFDGERASHDFLSHGVTFCALLPMRSIPARVVVLLGMNDGDFPRATRSPGFDRIAEQPRVGDRSVRNDDRYLFLEALLSARERLLISYVGRDVHDDSVKPPSVVVGELCDAIDEAFVADGARRVSEQLVVQHPLQAFSPRYFGADSDSRLFSYSGSDAAGARALLRERALRVPFHTGALPALDSRRALDLDELVRFLQNPARGFLRQRLGVFLDDEPELVEDREPIEISPRDRYPLGAWMLKRALDQGAEADVAQTARARGVLPYGTPGDCLLVDLASIARSIDAKAKSFMLGGALPPLELRLLLGQTELLGVLRDVYRGAAVNKQYSRVRAKNELGLWVRHLALQLVLPETEPCGSVLIGRAEQGEIVRAIAFDPLPQERAREYLRQLVDYYWLGQTRSLPLFPATSRSYVENAGPSGDGKHSDKALERARDRFDGVFDKFPEADDPYVRRAFAGLDPLSEPEADAPAFTTLATRVFGPLLENLRTV